MQALRSALPRPGELLVETFHTKGTIISSAIRSGLERAPVAGHADHEADGARGLQPWLLSPPIMRSRSGFAAHARPESVRRRDIVRRIVTKGFERSHLLKRAFREVAVIGVSDRTPASGKRKTGKQVTFQPT
ncbi:hypothetical protein OVY29_16700 [Sphingopyxis sp. SE2]|uniref:hypothetical protein n=1 Tax=Sphingopyxis sp. SE2 TaxID=1586240 RepID=UPI0028C126E3|nr:hypothetical protein [Sphingopyxis sp. SE2]MDT7530301.1 hypothetical protein [Sphingopyxis sp. SE2]